MSHPYTGAAAHRLWRRAVTEAGADTDPVGTLPFRIARRDRVMTAGSCFAQHISARLRDGGFAFLVTEPAHPLLPEPVAAAHHYGRFTARYGNIYTARQLLQLLHRAEGAFIPREADWRDADGGWIDPFRPTVQPGGFASHAELVRDRAQHLAAVRRAFATLDVLVFTLGLTESWISTEDGAVFPACPGTAGGRYDETRHRFHNQTVDEVIADLSAFVDALRRLNPAARLILTVSPVPLVATATDDHVLQATTYSKAVLRVAAQTVRARHPGIAYFPSYEIVTGPQAGNRYFADDLRSITAAGVDRVMALFFAHATEDGGGPPVATAPDRDDFVDRSRAAMDLLCDEELLDRDA